MDITDLLIRLQVEIAHFPPCRGIERALKVRVQATPALLSLGGDVVLGVELLGTVGRVHLAVELRQGGCESRGETMLLVQRDGLLDGLIADRVAVSKVLGDNS